MTGYTVIGREGNFLIARTGGPEPVRLLDFNCVGGDIPLGTYSERGQRISDELSRFAAQFPDTFRLAGVDRLCWPMHFPSAEAAGEFYRGCREAGLALLRVGNADLVRIVPPITLTDDEIDLGLSIIHSVLLGPDDEGDH